MDKFVMYKKISGSKSADAVQNTVSEKAVSDYTAAQNYDATSIDINYVQNYGNNTSCPEKAVPRALQFFLENQVRHEKLSKKIDETHGVKGK